MRVLLGPNQAATGRMLLNGQFLLVALVFLLSSCAPGPSPSASSSQPASLSLKALWQAGSTVASTRGLFNATLALIDAAGAPSPYLAESLPQLNSDSWSVMPDGRMETTSPLRADLSWHDRMPLTADDFVFGWPVYAERPHGQAPARFPTLFTFGSSVGENMLIGMNSAGIPRPENRWSSSNRGGWSNSEFDRPSDTLVQTVDPDRRAHLIAQLTAMVSREAVAIPLYFHGNPVAVTSAITGPGPVVQETPFEWNIHEWTRGAT